MSILQIGRAAPLTRMSARPERRAWSDGALTDA
jgi:hypothetical protein